jgi:hypothetical protein
MATARDRGNPLWAIVAVALLLCCGLPVYSWYAISRDQDAKAAFKPVALSFLDAWRDGDPARAEPLTCDITREDLTRRFREEDLASHGTVEVHARTTDSGTSYFAESDLTFADGRRHRYRLIMAEADGGWRVCSFKETYYR